MSEQRHLKRLDVIWRKGPLYFITTCVARRRAVLNSSAIHAILRDEWAAWRERRGWLVGRYVIMPDHVHFFAAPVADSEHTLNLAMGKWKEWTAKRILRTTGGAAPFWQAGFFDHFLRSEESLVEKWDYVRENPVRAGLVGKADDWPYAGWIDFQ